MDYSRYISSRAQSLKPSGIRKFFDVAASMPNCISLGVGEPNFVTPDYAREAAIASIQRGETKYTSNSGLIELREAIKKYLSQRFNLEYDVSQIIITVGVSEAIDNTLRALINFGDEVLIPEPCFVSYAPCVTLAGGAPISIPCTKDNGFILTKEQIKSRITDKTKLVFVPFPSNPTGGIMTKEQLEDIAEVIIENDLLVLSDEVYAELTYGENKHYSIANVKGMQERTVYLNGFSKAFAMTGWRIGFAAAPVEIIQQILKIHQYAIMCAPTAGQYAALACLEEGFKDNFATVEMMKAEYDRKRKFLYKSLLDMGLECFEPLGAFYMFPSVESTGMNGEEFATAFLKSHEVAVVPGGAFGNSGVNHIRISYAYSMEKLEKAMDRMREFLKKR
ncbi:MAG: aminotransferase class I/II-fold pyridoxal phosphate-dependent enzyme [Christensenellales bacterium]|jgi:aminotransferase|nr:aminotransferase class I/II-fold pyridoxal phosphate-dependent enzyme [Clostridiales bacterium]